MKQQPSLSVLGHSLRSVVPSKLMGIKLLQQVHKNRILFFACCCQKLFQLLTGYREVKLGNSARRIAHLAGFKPIPSPCNTESGPGEISSGSPCEISRLESFVLSFPLTYFLSLMAHFWEGVVGGSPPERGCCWVGTQPCLLTVGQFQSIFLLPWSTSWSTQSQKRGSD